MLGTEIVKQGQLFLEAALTGALLLLLYDMLRILRRIRGHGIVAVAVEDLLFWLFCALWIFGFMYRQNDGVIRGFLIFGAAVGMIAYSALASRYVVCAGTAGVRWILCALRRFFRLIGAPFARFGRFFWKKTVRGRNFCEKSLYRLKKRLKKLGKAVKIIISRL